MPMSFSKVPSGPTPTVIYFYFFLTIKFFYNEFKVSLRRRRRMTSSALPSSKLCLKFKNDVFRIKL